MKRTHLSLAAVAVTLLCVNNGIAGNDEILRRGEGGSERLYYFFSLDDAQQRERAVDLQRLVQPFGTDLEVTGIVREESVSAYDLGLSYDLVTRRAAQIEMPANLERFFDYENDHAVLVDADGRVVANGPGSDLGQVLAHVGNKGVVTEIDESTWGKIKELFQ
jgi:hypothetical protein